MLRVRSNSVQGSSTSRKERTITPEITVDIKKAFLDGIDKAWCEIILKRRSGSEGQLVVSRDEAPFSLVK